MSKISVVNDLHLHGVNTNLSSSVVAGATTSPVKNTAGFTTQYAVQIGETGQDQTEVVIGTAASGTSLTHPALAFDHPADTPVYDIKFNQVVFEKSTNGTAGTAAPIANGTISYRPDQWDKSELASYTIYDDGAGATTDAYRTMFRNSVLGSNTSESDWITPAGPSFYSLQAITDRIRAKLWNSNFILSNDRVHDWVNELKDNWANAVITVNQDYSLGTTNVAFGTAGLGTITDADFSQVRRFWVQTDATTVAESQQVAINALDPNQIVSSVNPQHQWIGNNVFKVNPAGAGGTAQLVIYKFGTTMVNETDELPIPFRSYTDAFVNYGVAQALFVDGKLNEYGAKIGEVNNSKGEFINNIIPRDRSGVSYMNVIDPISGEDKLF